MAPVWKQWQEIALEDRREQTKQRIFGWWNGTCKRCGQTINHSRCRMCKEYGRVINIGGFQNYCCGQQDCGIVKYRREDCGITKKKNGWKPPSLTENESSHLEMKSRQELSSPAGGAGGRSIPHHQEMVFWGMPMILQTMLTPLRMPISWQET